MRNEILNALNPTGARDTHRPGIAFTEKSEYGEVSRLAVDAVSAAVSSLQLFVRDIYNQELESVINQRYVDMWCTDSFVSDDWETPSIWDQFSHDYRTKDHFVRLHCNAPHHRKAALGVLNNPDTLQQAKSNALQWSAHELADAIVAAGGCAAELLTAAQWQQHPQAKAVKIEPVIAWNHHDNSSSTWQPRSPEKPLRGLKVLDLTRIIAGPVSTRFLASLGASVLRIDPPGWSEGAGEIEMTLGKSCAELNLRQQTDRDKLIDLIQSADVLVHGYRKDALEGLGFGMDSLAELNSALISVSLTAYGWTGPWSKRRGFDSLVQRSSGLAVEHQGRVISLPYQVLDHSTGYLMAAATIEALRFQLTLNKVAHAKLSLARQAQLLLDTGADASHFDTNSSLGRVEAAQKHGTYEKTHWGGGWRCPLPYELKGLKLGWRVPAHPLRSDALSWPA